MNVTGSRQDSVADFYYAGYEPLGSITGSLFITE
jgi:hypothetical protein